MKLTISIGPDDNPIMTVTGEKDYEKILSILEKTLQKCAEEGAGWVREGVPDIIHKDLAIALAGLAILRERLNPEDKKTMDGIGSLLLGGIGHHKGDVFRETLALKIRVKNGEDIG